MRSQISMEATDKRHLGDVAGKLAHAAGVDARGVPARVVLLEQDRLDPAQRQMQRGGAAVDAAADDDDIGRAGHCRATAAVAASV